MNRPMDWMVKRPMDGVHSATAILILQSEDSSSGFLHSIEAQKTAWNETGISDDFSKRTVRFCMPNMLRDLRWDFVALICHVMFKGLCAFFSGQ